MSDRLQRLEAQLGGLRPRPLPDALYERIAADLRERRPWADRFLVSAMCTGALAACVIVGILFIEPDVPPQRSPAAASAMQDDADVPRFAEHWFARAPRETS